MDKNARPIHTNTVEVALGDALERTIQSCVKYLGRKVLIPEAAWLEGPVGDAYVGADFYRAVLARVRPRAWLQQSICRSTARRR